MHTTLVLLFSQVTMVFGLLFIYLYKLEINRTFNTDGGKWNFGLLYSVILTSLLLLSSLYCATCQLAILGIFGKIWQHFQIPKLPNFWLSKFCFEIFWLLECLIVCNLLIHKDGSQSVPVLICLLIRLFGPFILTVVI